MEHIRNAFVAGSGCRTSSNKTYIGGRIRTAVNTINELVLKIIVWSSLNQFNQLTITRPHFALSPAKRALVQLLSLAKCNWTTALVLPNCRPLHLALGRKYSITSSKCKFSPPPHQTQPHQHPHWQSFIHSFMQYFRQCAIIKLNAINWFTYPTYSTAQR